jgi:hypothetical protein
MVPEEKSRPCVHTASGIENGKPLLATCAQPKVEEPPADPETTPATTELLIDLDFVYEPEVKEPSTADRVLRASTSQFFCDLLDEQEFAPVSPVSKRAIMPQESMKDLFAIDN